MRRTLVFPALTIIALAVSRPISAAPLGAGATLHPVPGGKLRGIVGGTTDTGDPAVVMLLATVGGGQAICTGEVVSPHVVMTAAHCVDPATVGTVTSFDVFLGYDVNTQGSDATKWIHVTQTHYNMAFDPSNLGNGQDVAVAILATPAPVTPIAANTTALTAADIGQPLRLVGYGIDSGTDTSGTSAGVKRQVTTTLQGFDGLLLQYGDATHNTCEGDSGGPGFMTLGGKEVIVGITSFGDQYCMMGGYDTRVDTVAAAFVEPYITMFDPGTPPPLDAGPPGPPPPALDAGRPPPPPFPDARPGPGPGSVDASNPNPSGTPLGGACTTGADCRSGTCLSVAGAPVCTSICNPNQPSSCPSGFACTYTAGQDLCLTAGGGAPSGGCSAAPSRGGRSGLVLLALMALAFAVVVRRRPNG